MKAGSEVVNFRKQSFYIYENTLKLCPLLSKENMEQFLTGFQEAFIERFTRLIFDMSDSVEMNQNESFTHDLTRLTNIERELFDMHKR